jgi:hypothetical protein
MLGRAPVRAVSPASTSATSLSSVAILSPTWRMASILAWRADASFSPAISLETALRSAFRLSTSAMAARRLLSSARMASTGAGSDWRSLSDLRTTSGFSRIMLISNKTVPPKSIPIAVTNAQFRARCCAFYRAGRRNLYPYGHSMTVGIILPTNKTWLLRGKKNPPLLCRTRGGSWYHLLLLHFSPGPARAGGWVKPRLVLYPSRLRMPKFSGILNHGHYITGRPGPLMAGLEGYSPSTRACARATACLGGPCGAGLQTAPLQVPIQGHRRGFLCLARLPCTDRQVSGRDDRYLSPGMSFSI